MIFKVHEQSVPITLLSRKRQLETCIPRQPEPFAIFSLWYQLLLLQASSLGHQLPKQICLFEACFCSNSMRSFDKEADSKPCLIFCSMGCIWELAHKLPLKGRRESDNKGRVMDCETLPDRFSFLELARKAKMDVIRGQVSGVAALTWALSLGRLLNGWAWKDYTTAVPGDSTHWVRLG